MGRAMMREPGAWTSHQSCNTAVALGWFWLVPFALAGVYFGYSATVEHWPAGVAPLPPRPATLMAFDVSDSTFLEGTRRFSW